jgi:hypothetical protein
MNASTLTLMVAIGTVWLSVTCGFIAVYLILTGEYQTASKEAQHRKSSASSKAPADEDAPILGDEKGESWGVQVLFDSPSPGQNERLSVALASAGGVFEQSTKVFTVKSDSSRIPIVIENAFPPRQLPSLTDDNSQFLIKGVNIKIVKTSRTLSPSKMQLAGLISLAKALARLGGTVVDAKQQPITKAGFNAVIAGKARV